MKEVYDLFGKVYEQYLGRELTISEKGVLGSATKILIWKVYGKNFNSIWRSRYAYTSRVTERRELNRKGDIEGLENIKAKYLVGCHDIPNKKLRAYPLIRPELPAEDVDYDLIIYDTYDYLDKIIELS